jgi:hypothetical protein
MMRLPRLLAVVLGLALLAGCSDDGVTGVWEGPTEPHAGLQSSHVTAASTFDISGTWSWSEVSQLRMPTFVAEDLVGIDAEGPMTHARCEAAGTMTLVQTGGSFSGMAMTNFQQCVTRGGQVFSSPDAGLPKVVADGQIRGASLSFSFSNFVVTPCLYHAVISAEDGSAGGLKGTGRCILPGHPQSESPVEMDPPPGGTSKALSWEAVRP